MQTKGSLTYRAGGVAIAADDYADAFPDVLQVAHIVAVQLTTLIVLDDAGFFFGPRRFMKGQRS